MRFWTWGEALRSKSRAAESKSDGAVGEWRRLNLLAGVAAVLALHGVACNSAAPVHSGSSDGGADEPAPCNPAGKRCASSSAVEAACTDQCESGEICFTQVSCGTLSEGGSSCRLGAGDAGDDRCHRACSDTSECNSGEECVRIRFFGCTDFNGFPNGRGICVEAAAVGGCAP